MAAMDPRTLAILQAMEPAAMARQQAEMEQYANVRQAAAMPQMREPVNPERGPMLAPPMPTPRPAPPPNMLAAAAEPATTGSVTPPPTNMLAAAMPPPRRVYDPAAGTNQPRFITEGPARPPMAGSAVATSNAPMAPQGSASPPAGGGFLSKWRPGGLIGGLMSDDPASAWADWTAGLASGGFGGAARALRGGQLAREKQGLSAQQLNMTAQAARRLGVPDDVIAGLGGKELASLVMDIQKQTMGGGKEPTLTSIYDDQGREQKGYMRAGQFVPVGGAKAAEVPDSAKPTTDMREYELAKSQGFEGSFVDYQRQMREAGRTQVNVDTGVKLPSGFRWKDPNNQDLGVEPIPGGPATQIPAELAARVGLADDWLKNYDALEKDVSTGDATGPLDSFNAQFNNSSRAADIYRRAQSGTDALMRMLTGAGMNQTEAEQYARRYLPGATDTADSAVAKLRGLKRELESVREKAMRGRGEAPKTEAPTAPPAGVEPGLWQYMTPEERALWN